MVEIPGPLPARPPTPPRPGSRTDDDEQQPARLLLTPEASAHTPNTTRIPPSSHGSKRVNFSPWLHTVIGSPKPNSDSRHPEKTKSGPAHPRSSTELEGRPFKSILKETSSPIPAWSPNVNKFTTQSIDMLLESVVQQLTGESISSRLDAYMNLFNALRTYDTLPGGKEIGDKLGLITEFIQRDVTRDLIHGTPMDTTIANQALKLAAAFIWQPDISTQVSEDFKIFLVEHAITSLQESKAAKSVLTHYLSILSTQNFSPKIMTASRVTRLLTALKDLSNHVSGKAISFHRLSIYQRLLTQFKSLFIQHSALWIEHLVSGLLHSNKDTRVKAIALGFQISAVAGPTTLLSDTVKQLFDRPLEGKRKLVTEIKERMSRMVAALETGIHVPQIWSIIVLLLRSKKRTLDQWVHFKEWVLVLQKCFNCSESAIKAQAIVGWNRFIYAVSPNENTSRSLLKMLGKPVFSQFERKKSDRAELFPSQLALSSYYHLLYYAFRPSLPYHHVDVIWEEYVAAPSANVLCAYPAVSDITALVVANLLWSSQAKVWTETRITDNARMGVEELPSLESRWVRARVSLVLAVFESLLRNSAWDRESIDKSNIAIAWRALASALSFASSKEITPSGESMQAVASVLGLLHRIWAAGPGALNAEGEDAWDAFMEIFLFLSTTMISSLGGVPFTEKVMLQTEDGAFQTSSTPTHRPSSLTNNLNTPIIHLLRMISSESATVPSIPSYARLVGRLIETSCDARISRGSRLELLGQCAEMSVKSLAASTSAPHLAEKIWSGTAQAVSRALRSLPVDSARERDAVTARDYEIILNILLAGMTYFPNSCSDWSCLLGELVNLVKTEKGDGACANLVVEPIARRLSALPILDTYVPISSLLSHCLAIPIATPAEVGVEKSDTDLTKEARFPHDLLTAMTRSLDLGYHKLSHSKEPHVATFIESVASFLVSGSQACRIQAAKVLQSPLALWIADAESKLFASRGVNSQLVLACHALSTSLLNTLRPMTIDGYSSLQHFEPVICAGLNSIHSIISQQFVDFIGSAETITESLIEHTPMGQALSVATARLANRASSPDLESQSSNSVVDSHDQLHESATDDCSQESVEQTTNLELSSNIDLNDHVMPPPTELNEPQLPAYPGSEGGGSEAPLATRKSRRQSQREMFRMIESIRSSSPANDPGKSGFDTPKHLHRLHLRSGVPLTPTLAPAENEEGFIGSSPTPATRDQTPTARPELLGRKRLASMNNNASDVPSSPPEVRSKSPSPKKPSSSSRRAKRRKLLHSSLAANAKSKEPANSIDARPPSRRTRSSQASITAAVDQSEAVLAPSATSASPAGLEDQGGAPKSEQSKSSSNKRKRNGSMKSAEQEQVQPVQVASTPVVPDEHADSSSEDLESQVASQIEQDMELVVDMLMSVSPSESEVGKSATKKRKREDEHAKATVPDRRRSTRLSTANEATGMETEEAGPSRLPTATSSQPSDNRSASSLSPTMTRRVTRSSQKRENELLAIDSKLETEDLGTKQELTEDSISSQPIAKESRRSVHFKDEAARPVRAVDAPRSKASRSSRSHKSRSSHTELRSPPVSSHSERGFSQNQLDDEPASVAAASMDALASGGTDASVNSSLQKSEQGALSPVFMSTEEASKVPATGLDSVHSARSQGIDFRGSMEVNTMPESITAEEVSLTLDFATVAVQTEPVLPTRHSDNSEAGITQSLRDLLSEIKTASLGPNALREIDDLLFHIRVEAHEASRRHNSSA
ncbi:hypothetical protein N7539_006612 [Penicillium diatomitis]|uniref:Telomere-associated protein Rif1 N-terminal domain-containing protein n=1 Tax=Penicillium diatomitis TaxID=2819901 RepID=A0A9W9X1M0_9EURO|nr:uncharacterized protein N7539_006612 [Penicillium diatomitis]KAJ5480718.1 hypothetical protein N7539_006612 [Penicillium diatomitis]